MIATAHLAEFLLSVFALIVVPGPSVLFVVSRGVAHGRRAALATVLGNTGGLLLQLAVVLAGVGAVITGSQRLHAVVTLAGGTYLVVLGLRAIIHRHDRTAAFGADRAPAQPLAVVIREGFVVGATNPKGLIILTAVVPAFIDPASDRQGLQLATMGLIVAAMALISDGVWALASGATRTWLSRTPARTSWLTAGGGVTMMALGVAVLLSGRRR